jgi:hypothetical protein
VSDAPFTIPEDDLLPPLPESLSKWTNVALPIPPPELTGVLQTITDIGNATVAILNIIKTLLDTLANITIDLDPAKAILAAAIAAIEEGIKTLIEESGIYVLYVPVRRKIIVPPTVRQALDIVGLTDGIPYKSMDANLLVVQVRLVSQSAEALALLTSSNGGGGNAGFFQTVVEATYDEKDSNRPQFGNTDYVAGLHIVAGAPDYLQLLSLLTALDGLLVPPASTGLRASGLPVPQNLKVQPVMSLDGKPAALLNWDARTAYVEEATLDTSCLITHVAIIRSKSAGVLGINAPEKLFGTNKLTKGMVSPSDPDTVVVDILDYADVTNPTPNTYNDYSGGLEAGTVYYYHASYRLKVGTLDAVFSGGSTTDIGYYKLSNVAIATATTRPQRSSRGAPPDWIRTPSVVEMLPLVGDLAKLLLGTLNQFKASTTGQADNFKTYVAFLQTEMDRFAKILGAFAGLVSKLTQLSTASSAVGVYGRAYAGKGGVDFMLADLGASLSPSNDDPGRPPFDKGTEFVTGTTILIGGPSEAGVTAVATMINSLFGLSSGGATSPLAQALAAIDVAITDAEQVQLGADLTAGTASTTTAALTGDVPLSDDDPGSCGPDETPAPVFGDDLGVS